MNSQVKNQAGLISELLDSTSDVGIILGENQNIDTVGAALGLYLVLTSVGKNVQIVSKKVPEVGVSNLFGVDKISTSFGGNAKSITISIPYHEEIEKVSYNIEGDKLFVNLFAEELGIDLDESQIEYIRKGSNPGLIITIGVPDERELTSLVDPSAVRMLHIDNNPSNALIGDVLLVDSAFSSVSEIVAEMIRELSIGFDQDGYQNLMDGIDFATKGLTSPTTSGFAFESVGFLMQNGAKRPERQMNDQRSKIVDERNEQNESQNQGRQDRRDDRNQDRQVSQGQREERNQDRRDNQAPRNDRDRNRDRNRDRQRSNNQDPRTNNQPRDDRNRNFPSEDHFLNPRPQRGPQDNNRGGQNQQRDESRIKNQNQNTSQANQSQQSNQYVEPATPVQPVSETFDTPELSDTSNLGMAHDPLTGAAEPIMNVSQDPTTNNQQPVVDYSPKPYRPEPTSKEAVDMDMPSEAMDMSSTEGVMPDEIPDDWFLPKVFKGTKKTNN